MPKKRALKKVIKAPNMLFPGLPNYKGPDKGWFAWVHHGKLFEHTDYAGNSITARVQYVRARKPKDEVRIRLAHIMYLGSYLGRKLSALRDEPGYTENSATANAWVMKYIKKHKPRNRWHVHGRGPRYGSGTLTKANGTAMTG